MRAVVSVVVVAVLAVCGAACGGKEIKPSPVGESSAVATPNAGLAEYPADARPDTESAAIEFAQFYVLLINDAVSTGQSEALVKYSRNCAGCLKVVKRSNQIFDAGGKTTGLSWTFSHVKVGHKGMKTLLDGNVQIAAGTIQESASAPTITDYKEVASQDTQFGLVRVGDEWRVTDLIQP